MGGACPSMTNMVLERVNGLTLDEIITQKHYAELMRSYTKNGNIETVDHHKTRRRGK
jgi:hypothetical protein